MNKLTKYKSIGFLFIVLFVGIFLGYNFTSKAITKEVSIEKEVIKYVKTGECEAITPTTYTSLFFAGTLGDVNLNSLIRCDKNSCDSYPMEFSQNGIFTNIQLENPSGAIFKFVNIDESTSGLKKNDFVEINTLGLTSYISWGTCKETSSGITNIKSLKCVPSKQIVCSFSE